MPSVLVSLPFTADADNFVDDGIQGNIHFSWDAGGYSDGCGLFAGVPAGTYPLTINESATQVLASQTWETLGVPAGKQVSGVTCLNFYQRVLGATFVPLPGGSSYEEHLRLGIVDDTGNDVLAGYLVDVDPGQTSVGWVDSHSPVMVAPINVSLAQSTQEVRFKLSVNVATSNMAIYGTYDRYVDSITVQIDYIDGPDPPGGGAGGGDGGGTIITDGHDGGEPTEGDCAIEDIALGYPVHDTRDLATAWVHERRYYVSIGGRTLCRDTETGGWTDAGYGQVRNAEVVTLPGMPDLMFLCRTDGPGSDGRQPFVPVYGRMVQLSHRMLDHTAPHTSSPWVKKVVYGPFDGNGPDQTRRKRARSVQVFGSMAQADSAGVPIQLGTLRMCSDTGRVEEYPIWPANRTGYTPFDPKVAAAGILIEQMFTNAMVGRVLWVELEFTYQCVTLTNVLLEYVPLT